MILELTIGRYRICSNECCGYNYLLSGQGGCGINSRAATKQGEMSIEQIQYVYAATEDHVMVL